MLFEHAIGSVWVTLCWPSDMPCLDDRWGRLNAFCTADDWDVEREVAALDFESFTPVWTVTYSDCVEHDHIACNCGVVDLVDALALLPLQRRRAAIAAHADLVADLRDHARAARLLVSSEGADLPSGPICIGCLTCDPRHTEAIDLELAERTRELRAAEESALAR